MNSGVDHEWWKDLFDEVYLLTDARSVCDEGLTAEEVDFLQETLRLDRASPLLDLCGGQGRHALELSRRGFSDVTVLDYSVHLINLGRARARQEGLGTVFVRGDARSTGLSGQSFQCVIIMGSSFGYFPEEEENGKILLEAFRLLKSGGTLLLDLPDRDFVIRNFRAFSSHMVDDDIRVDRRRELTDDVIYGRETVTSKRNGNIRDRTYCTRLYSPEKITGLVSEAGFSSVACRRDFMNRALQGDYGCMTNRMIVKAVKANGPRGEGRARS